MENSTNLKQKGNKRLTPKEQAIMSVLNKEGIKCTAKDLLIARRKVNNKTQKKTKPNKKQVIKLMCAVFLGYMNEKLENAALILNVLNSLQDSIQESCNEIKQLKKEMRGELDFLVKKAIEINSKDEG
jgi:uncharacterized protein with ParB-like and HNH nuclease domain